MIRGPEIGRHAGGANEPSVELVSPLVIGTDELHAPAMAVGTDLRPAVATGIVKAANEPVAAAYDQHRTSTHGDRSVRAGFGQFRLESDHQPRTAENSGDVEVVELRIGIKRLRQGITG